MSGFQRVYNYCCQNPVATYLGGGVVLHLLRSFSVNQAYTQNFARYDVERQHELEQYLATHQTPAQQ